MKRPLQASWLEALKELETAVRGKSQELKLALTCLLAEGHLLIEDRPGRGKTTLAKALGKVLQLSTQRIQCTNDLLPMDILGGYSLKEGDAQPRFHKGPIFTQLLFVDEINRASPRTQSAFLQAMEEYEVSIEGKTWELPRPFHVIATQNPMDHAGVFPLPESQLDRFLFKMELGYPDRSTEMALFSTKDLVDPKNLKPLFSPESLRAAQMEVLETVTSPPILEYLMKLIDKSRTFHRGLSTRAAQKWLRAAQAWAYLDQRHNVNYQDLQDVGFYVVRHRLEVAPHEERQAFEELIKSVSIEA